MSRRVLLDVGAAHGLYSLIAARTCPPENIHCVEPDPVARWILNINNSRYGIGRSHLDPHPVEPHAQRGMVTLDEYCQRHRNRSTHWQLVLRVGQPDLAWSDTLPKDVNCALLAEPFS